MQMCTYFIHQSFNTKSQDTTEKEKPQQVKEGKMF